MIGEEKLRQFPRGRGGGENEIICKKASKPLWIKKTGISVEENRKTHRDLN